MIRIVILEDEPPARARLEAAIGRCDPTARVVAALDGVDAAADWLARHDAPDLIFADIQLGDGLSFELFDRVAVTCPIVFCTAFDQYVLDAMTSNGIEYLLKPIRDEHVARALARYHALESHFVERLASLREALAAPAPRRRLLARRGAAHVALALDDLAYLVVEDKVALAVTRSGERAFVDRPLSELETELDPAEFFRLNRQYLVRASAVRAFRPYFKGRLLVELAPPAGRDVVVSGDNVGRFRAWLDR